VLTQKKSNRWTFSMSKTPIAFLKPLTNIAEIEDIHIGTTVTTAWTGGPLASINTFGIAVVPSGGTGAAAGCLNGLQSTLCLRQ
jgi:hypothetical protein